MSHDVYDEEDDVKDSIKAKKEHFSTVVLPIHPSKVSRGRSLLVFQFRRL